MAKSATALKRKLVNPPLISLAHTPNVSIEVTGEFYRMHAPGLSRNEDGNVTVLPVVDNETGEIGNLLSTAVLESTLTKLPGGYVGKKFEIEAGEPKGENKYRPVKVYELSE